MAFDILAALLIAYLPGALAYRLPMAERERRAALAADERAFWHVILSLAWSLTVVLALALAGRYRFDYLLSINAGACLACLAVGRGGLRYAGRAAPPTWHIVLPLVLIGLGLMRFFPPSEFIVGGQDPGIYMNEGIQIAQRGAIVTTDPVVATVRPEFRDLFIARNTEADAAYYGLRFMGFFVRDPDAGTVVGQFPHLFPASIAIGYGLDGLTGARRTSTVWALIGLLAVYFGGRYAFGTPTAFAAALLLGLHVILTWYAKEPNAEVVMLTFLFAGTLAFARAHQEDDRFFAPVAAVLFVLLLFLRVDTLVLLLAVGVAAILSWLVKGQAPRAAFVIPLGLGSVAAWAYLTGPMAGYMTTPTYWLSKLPWFVIGGGLAAGAAAIVAVVRLRERLRAPLEWMVPAAYVVVLLGLAYYALHMREAGGRLTDYDAYALRWFAHLYLGEVVLAMALVALGFAAVRFWRAPALFMTFAAFATFFFYKIRIVPTHFWASRRFLPVILPMALLLAAYWLFLLIERPKPLPQLRMPAWARALTLVGVVLLLGGTAMQYVEASTPVSRHVEYAGVIPYLERLSERFTDRDLVIVEARDASDMHVLATPLAYIYARQVLLLASPVPDKTLLHSFLIDAQRRYDRVFFMGGGGTDLLARNISATAAGGDTVQVPEYAATAWDVYPDHVAAKEFDYSIYELSTAPRPPGPFVLDVGTEDDLYVLRFHAKEQSDGRTVRWTSPQSQVSVIGLTGGEREVLLTMHDGGRPAAAGPATVEVAFDEVTIGTLTVGSGFQTYALPLPEELAEAAAAREVATRLRLRTSTWQPSALVGGSDTRQLGVMLDRIEIR